jgi:hypothetical protein
MGISALLHLLLLLFASRAWIPVRSHGGGAEAAARPAGSSLPEMQALRLRLTDDAEPLAPEEVPEEVPERAAPEMVAPRRTPIPVVPASPAVDPRARGEGTQPDAAAPTARTPAERMQPGLGDPRLWERPGAPPEPEKSDFERARERVYARIDALNDSLAAEGAAADRATDWTFTDKDGKKWGVSPGGIHLGGVTLPIPIRAPGPPDKAKEERDRARKGAEIDWHGDRARVRGSIQDQIKATREEKDRARAAKRDSTKAGGE